MTDWDLLTPGIGLTSIGIATVGISLSGIAETFIEGMHAVGLLTMFIGMIFLAAGLFKDGFPSTARAKSATFITLGFLVTFGFAAAVTVSTQVPSIFVYIGLMMIIAIPSSVLAVASYKRTPYIKALAVIFIGAAVVGGSAFYAFGLVTPKVDSSPLEQANSTQSTTNNETIDQRSAETTPVSMHPGSSAQGNPSYHPAWLNLTKDTRIEWKNNDNVPHTVTGLTDDGKTFDSTTVKPDAFFPVDTADLSPEI
jgi:plastocyanin